MKSHNTIMIIPVLKPPGSFGVASVAPRAVNITDFVITRSDSRGDKSQVLKAY